MKAMSELIDLVQGDAPVCGPEDAERNAQRLYDRIRREALHELALGDDDGFLALSALGRRGDQAGDPLLSHEEITELWLKIRTGALAAASESLAWHSERAVNAKVRFALDWSARKVHQMIIDPKGNHHGDAGTHAGQPDRSGSAPDAGGERGESGVVRPERSGGDGDGPAAASDSAGAGD